MIAIEATNVGTIPAASLEQRRDTLYARLETGFETIERAAESGQNVTRWEQAWLLLLRKYQEVCDQIASRRAAAPAGYSELAASAD